MFGQDSLSIFSTFDSAVSMIPQSSSFDKQRLSFESKTSFQDFLASQDKKSESTKLKRGIRAKKSMRRKLPRIGGAKAVEPQPINKGFSINLEVVDCDQQRQSDRIQAHPIERKGSPSTKLRRNKIITIETQQQSINPFEK